MGRSEPARCGAATPRERDCNERNRRRPTAYGIGARTLLYAPGVQRHWDWVGLAAGVATGLADYGLFLAMGSPELAPPRPEYFAAGLAFVFGALGFAVGRLAQARQRARRDAGTIACQLEALERAQRDLVQQEKLAALGRLAAGVAHEVRNPLGVIRAAASMVQEGFAPGDEAHRACRFICEEIDRLNTLITALLAFARPSEPRFASAAIAPAVERVLELARQAARARDVRLAWERAPLPEVRADPDLLAQLLLDLVHNAVEAVAPGGCVAVRAAADGASVRIEVSDDGPGVPPERRQAVFEPFVTTKPRGTGLGLAMASRIAEAHGGPLVYVPGAGLGPEGRGACFRFALPRTVGAEAAA